MPRRAAILTPLLALLAGCGQGSPSLPPPSPPVVSVAKLAEREVGDYADFTGRTEATASVNVKARATGYLKEVKFKEGEDVKKGDLLYKIDDRTYKADLEKQQAEIVRLQATLNRLGSDLTRAKRLSATSAMSREEYDKISTSRDETAAQLTAAQAAAKSAALELSFTEVHAEIAGRVSKTNLTEGNLVTKDTTLLTTIRQFDPIWAYFDVDERTALEVQRQIQAGKFKDYREAAFPVLIGTMLEKDFPHEGKIDFVENTLDPGTATLRVRGVFANPKAMKDLSPGMFVRVRVPLGGKRKSLVVAERALGSNQGMPFLYVVNDKGVVDQRAVVLGPRRDGMRVIESGVKAGERVVVDGLQRVRPGVTVEGHEVAMPTPEK